MSYVFLLFHCWLWRWWSSILLNCSIYASLWCREQISEYFQVQCVSMWKYDSTWLARHRHTPHTKHMFWASPDSCILSLHARVYVRSRNRLYLCLISYNRNICQYMRKHKLIKYSGSDKHAFACIQCEKVIDWNGNKLSFHRPAQSNHS